MLKFVTDPFLIPEFASVRDLEAETPGICEAGGEGGEEQVFSIIGNVTASMRHGK